MHRCCHCQYWLGFENSIPLPPQVELEVADPLVENDGENDANENEENSDDNSNNNNNNNGVAVANNNDNNCSRRRKRKRSASRGCSKKSWVLENKYQGVEPNMNMNISYLHFSSNYSLTD